jgi:hypothetical protein
MEKLQEFQVAARVDGFVEVNEGGGADADANVAWFRSKLPDAESKVHKRLCIDGLTCSATIYWETAGAKLNSKTFRTVSSMKAWLSLNLVR